ncbi:hypothetical protein Tco_0009073 [Tanacetum coccineum]
MSSNNIRNSIPSQQPRYPLSEIKSLNSYRGGEDHHGKELRLSKGTLHSLARENGASGNSDDGATIADGAGKIGPIEISREEVVDNQDEDKNEDDENVQDDDDDAKSGDDELKSQDDQDDDDETIHEEETDEDDTFDPIVHTPSHVSSSDDENSDNEVEGVDVEGEKSDEDATYVEDQGNEADRDTNANLEGRDDVMADVVVP